MVKIDDLQPSINIIKTLGSGTFGTTYLVKYKSNNYVLKIIKIIYSDKKLKENIIDYKEQFWREIDLYKFIVKYFLRFLVNSLIQPDVDWPN